MFSVIFNPLYSSTNQQLLEKHHCNTRMISVTKRSHHMPTTKSTLFAVSKDEWDAKEDTDKSTKNALCALQYAKRHFLG